MTHAPDDAAEPRAKPIAEPTATEPTTARQASEPTATERRASLRSGWTLLFVGALAGTALELAHAFKLAPYLDDPLTRLLLTLAHAHAVGLALVVLAHAHVGLPLDPSATTGRLLRVGAVLLPLGFALGAIAHPESDPSLGIVLAPVGALFVLVALARLATASWRPRTDGPRSSELRPRR